MAFSPLLAGVAVVVGLVLLGLWRRRQRRRRRQAAWQMPSDALVPPFHPAPLQTDLARLAVMAWNNHRLYEWVTDMTHALGFTWRTSVPVYGEIVFIGHPLDVQHMLKDNFWNYVKGELVHDALADFLGEGIFTTDGDRWRRQRQASSHLFKKRLLREAVRVFVCHSDDVLRTLRDAARTRTPIDVQAELHRYTMSAFCEIAFGAGALTPADVARFGAAFDRVSALTQLRTVNPFWKWLPRGAVRREVAVLDDIIYKLVHRRMREADAGLADKEDVISRFMSIDRSERRSGGSGDKGSGGGGGGGGGGDDDDGDGGDDAASATAPADVLDYRDARTIRDFVVNFILAGRDTTAQLLTWSLYYLATNDGAQRRLVAELRDAVGDDAAPTLENMAHLPYLRAVLDETLRLRPPVPLDFKQSVNGDVLPQSRCRVPPGTMVAWSAYAMGHCRELWREPERFTPERWLDAAHPVEPSRAIPFQTGPRLCLGMNFAYLEAKVLLASVLRRCSVALAPAQTVSVQVGVTLRAANGVKLLVSMRDAGD